jgi:hypothetical protein
MILLSSELALIAHCNYHKCKCIDEQYYNFTCHEYLVLVNIFGTKLIKNFFLSVHDNNQMSWHYLNQIKIQGRIVLFSIYFKSIAQNNKH